MNRKLLVALAGISLSAFAVSAANAATYKLDFGPDGSPATAGYVTTATSSIPFNSVTSPTFDLGGGAALSFTSVNNYNLGNADNPLVTDGFFVNGAAPAGNFTISGLNEGDLVTLYAINAWDGAGRAAFVSLAGGPYVDSGAGHDYTSASGQPGTNPSLSDFALVASGISVGPGGSLGGNFSFTNGVTSRPEGQLGGFIIDVTEVPEPATAGVLALAGATLTVRRRRR